MKKLGVEMVGDKALVAALAELGRTFGGPALDASGKKGSKVLVDGIEEGWKSAKLVNETAAKTKGKAVASAKLKGQPRHSPVFVIGMTGDAINTAHWPEFGVQAHSVKPGASIRQGRFVGHTPMHPGHAARPFFRPAYDQKGPVAIKVTMEEIVRHIERLTAKLYVKARGR